VALLGISAAVVADVLPGRVRAGFTGLAVASGVGLQLVSLGLLLERFYA
jgi:hypothetical protein